VILRNLKNNLRQGVKKTEQEKNVNKGKKNEKERKE
jgi:hypothetical protein